MSEDHLLALMAAILYSGERVAKVKKPDIEVLAQLTREMLKLARNGVEK
jgi:hypothetical protein